MVHGSPCPLKTNKTITCSEFLSHVPYLNLVWQPFWDDPIPDLHESLDNNIVVTRRIQLKEAFEELLKIPLWENLFLQDHLKHRLSKIMVWVIGILNNSDAFAELLAWADHLLALGIIFRLRRIWTSFDIERECGGGSVVSITSLPRTWWRRTRFRLLEMGGSGPWCWVDYVWELWPSTPTPSIGCEYASEQLFLVGRHCRKEREIYELGGFCRWKSFSVFKMGENRGEREREGARVITCK